MHNMQRVDSDCQYCTAADTPSELQQEAFIDILQVSKELATGRTGSSRHHQTRDSALALLPLLHQLLICPVFRSVAVSDALIADLSAYLAASATASVCDLAGIAEFQVRFL